MAAESWYNTPVLACLIAILELTISDVLSGKYDYTPATLSGTVQDVLDDETVEQLTNMALDCAKEVKHWKTSKKLGPYLPAERRVIHTALKENEFVTTNSIPAPEAGDRMKYVEILLK